MESVRWVLLVRLCTDSLLRLTSLAFCHRTDEEKLPRAKAGKTAQRVFLAAESGRFQELKPPWQVVSRDWNMEPWVVDGSAARGS